jgi:outer membrane protein assembly factor BamA
MPSSHPRGVVWLLVAAALLAPGIAPAAAPPKAARVGQIFIVGNERTRMNVILDQVPLYPGQILSYPALREAERYLARLNIFESSPDGSVRPTVTVLDNPLKPDSPYKDILINVQEANTGSLMFEVGITSSGVPCLCLVVQERNFDVARIPTCLDDLFEGSAFRGAAQVLRLELLSCDLTGNVSICPGVRIVPLFLAQRGLR